MWQEKEGNLFCYGREALELRKCLLAEDEVMKVSYNSIQTPLFSVRNFIGQRAKSNKSQDHQSVSACDKYSALLFYNIGESE